MNSEVENRMETKYDDHSEKFLVKTFDYQKQFSYLYAHRLAEMTILLRELVQQKWGNDYDICKLCDLNEDQVEPSIIIGTLYKHQAYKPSILREISEENQMAPQLPRILYADLEDQLMIEDELQRVPLCGKVDVRYMSTGVVCALLGNVEDDGRFAVNEVLYYESGPQRPLPDHKYGGRLLVIVSGLDQHQSYKYVDALNLFQHWLGGYVGDGGRAIRLIVAGNSLSSGTEHKKPSLQNHVQSSIEFDQVVNSMHQLDICLAAWSCAVPVDVMPGAHDPSNFMLPQQPFHKCIFPQASKQDSFRCVSNPYTCGIEDVLIVGTSGQNVHDLLRCTAIDKPLEALRSTLIWSHIAPTAPDTLSCFPYIDSDPFILCDCPHIYFAGNCDEYASELHTSSDGSKTTRIVCVPRFSETQSIVAVELDTLGAKR